MRRAAHACYAELLATCVRDTAGREIDIAAVRRIDSMITGSHSQGVCRGPDRRWLRRFLAADNHMRAMAADRGISPPLASSPGAPRGDDEKVVPRATPSTFTTAKGPRPCLCARLSTARSVSGTSSWSRAPSRAALVLGAERIVQAGRRRVARSRSKDTDAAAKATKKRVAAGAGGRRGVVAALPAHGVHQYVGGSPMRRGPLAICALLSVHRGSTNQRALPPPAKPSTLALSLN